MYQFISFVFSFFDPRLVPFVLVMNVVGYWVKKVEIPKLKWCPPLPLLIFLVSFFVSALFGWLVTDAEGGKAIAMSILYYGLGNGLLIGFLSTSGYDIVHSFIKKMKNGKEIKNAE